MSSKFTFVKFITVFSTVLACNTVHAQTSSGQGELSERLQAIEEILAERRAEIADLERQLAEIRSLTTEPSPRSETPLPTTSTSASTSAAPFSLLYDEVSLDKALADPNTFFEKLGASGLGPQVSAEELNDRASQPIFDRPNLPAGISAALTLGNSSEASINYSYPIVLRKRTSLRGDYRPQIGTFSGSVFTPLSSGVGTLFSDTDRNRLKRANADIPSGTRLRLAFDFLSYPVIKNEELRVDGVSRNTARRRVLDVLYAGREICLKQYAAPSATPASTFYEPFKTTPPPTDIPRSIPTVMTKLSTPPTPEELNARKVEVENLCSGDNLARFIVGQQADPTSPSGAALINPELAKNFLGAFWNAGANQLPDWGWGISADLGTTDFTYRQSINPITLVPDTAAADAGFPDRVTARIDPAAGFSAAETDSQNTWTVRGYGLFSLFNRSPRTRTPRWFFPGLTLVGSAEYASSYSFRPGTTNLSICPPQPIDPVTLEPSNFSVRCRNFNVDAPVETDGFTLATEARFRFLNVPLVNTLSFAPRYSHRLDDGAQTFDLPIYLQNDAKGFGSAGLRFRRSWGGRDLFGNPDFSASEISVFFVPLRFNGL